MVTLSVLDQSPIRKGGTAAQALRETIELARLEVADYLAEDGSVRAVSNLRATVAVNGVERPLHFNSQLVVESIDAYLAERAGWTIAPCPRCGLGEGLDPPSVMAATRFPDAGGTIEAFTAHCVACGPPSALSFSRRAPA